ncbi:outer membrane protein B [Capsulimonas corticalis]|uniref:Outer membrane protein B n=1 Tax=Capsulimonas corticalis TaxID=2219043 RepID=A0A402CQS0_9BACT|nr:right-handed parallel beta-helix repeat-containing protein [Capsulimonas corticalis]BDI32630.1 outer membrane protein B [Capsulimonas corticalis]
MTFRSMTSTLAVVGVALAFATTAHAQATRTWVSGVGDDVNPGSRTAPCKTIAGAISKTAAGGEIDALDPGGFGTITITKALTLDGGAGQVASILASGVSGITINAGPSDVVTIRNFRINGIVGTLSPGTIGIRFLAGKQLIIENCNVFGFSGAGVDVTTTLPSQVVIKHSSFTNTPVGVRENSASVASSMTLSDVLIQGAVTGVDTFSGMTQLLGCTVTQSDSFGLHAEGGTISVVKSLIANAGVAAQAENGSTIRLSDNDIFDNGVCFAYNGTGKISSAANNRKAGNGSSATPNGVITVQ